MDQMKTLQSLERLKLAGKNKITYRYGKSL